MAKRHTHRLPKLPAHQIQQALYSQQQLTEDMDRLLEQCRLAGGDCNTIACAFTEGCKSLGQPIGTPARSRSTL
jgi:hypothetical protein